MKKITAVFLCVVVTLSGCTSVPRIEYNKSSTPIKTIALLRVGESQNIVVMNMGGTTSVLLGAIGGAIEGSLAEDRSKAFAAVLNEKKLTMGPEITKHLKEQLEVSGYAVTYLDQVPTLAADGKTDDYSHIETTADAILNVWFGTTGYASPAFSPSFRRGQLFARVS